MRLAEWIWAQALRLYPPSFRERFGRDMRRAFRDGTRGSRRRGGRLGVAAFWLRCVVDLTAEVPAAWWAVRREHSMTGGGVMDGWVTDARHAWRGLTRRPGLAAVAVVTLALGLGANAAIFSVVNGVLLRPFDLPAMDELVVVRDRSTRGGAPFRTTGGAYSDWLEGNRTLSGLALIGGWTANLTEPGADPARLTGAAVSASYFRVLGVEPALGRVIRPEENRGTHRVAVLGDALWRGRFGADPGVIGRTVELSGESWEVVGVMPPLALPFAAAGLALDPTDREPRVWVPLNLESPWVAGHRSHVFVALGRLADGATVEAAAADLEAVTAGIARRHPEGYTDITSDVAPLREVVVGEVRRDLLVLLGAVGMVLLVACANLANVFLARALDRSRELAVRSAVGAGAGRLIRLGLLESALVGALGGLVGVVLAWAGLGVLLDMLPQELPRQTGIGLDGGVLAFTAVLSVAAGLAVGMLPALRGARPRLAAALKAGGRGSAGGHGSRPVRLLVAGQLALACVLLVGAGLLLRSFRALQGVELGARTDRTLSVELLQVRGGGIEPVAEFLRRLEERVEAIPGVEGAAVAYDTPLASNWTEQFRVVGRPPPEAGQTPGAHFRQVSPGYFGTVGIDVVRGRVFTEADGLDAPGVAVVNRAFAEEHFPGEEVLGQRLRVGTVSANWGDRAPQEFEVVGVVENVRFRGPRSAAPDAFYLSVRQSPTAYFHLLARATGEPLELVPAVRAAVLELDPDLPLSNVTTLAAEHARATARERFNALLLAVFAATALAVAAAGVYGVLAYAVARRRAEMGVRLALGAAPGGVLGLLLGEGIRMAAVGLGVGLAGGLLAGRLLGSLLFGVRPWDPVVLGSVAGTLAVAALLAAWLPALRASRTDPAVALRSE